MRQLKPGLSANIVGRFVRPTYLLELYYSDNPEDSPLRFCSNQTIIWDGQTWTEQGFKLNGIGWETRQSARPAAEFQNIDNLMASLLFNNMLADKPASAWIMYLYDKQIFYTDKIAYSGSTQISVVTPIPPEITVPGILWAGAGRTAQTSTSLWQWAFSSVYGNIFNLSAPLDIDIPAGQEIFALRKGSVGASYTDSTDAVKIFSGVIDEFEIDEKTCLISLSPDSTRSQFTPRRYITKQNGFNWLPQTGLQIVWRGEIFTLERAEY